MILFFNSLTRVSTGHVGVLTLFGRVTGQVLPEGMHLIKTLAKSAQHKSCGDRQQQERSAADPGTMTALYDEMPERRALLG